MKDILKLYDELKKIEGVDLALVETYIKLALKESNCANIQELVEMITAKKVEMDAFNDKSKEYSKKLNDNSSEQKVLLNSQIIEHNSITKKSSLLLLAILGVVGIDVVVVVTLFNIPAVIFAIVSILIAAKSGLKLRSRFYTTYDKNQERLDELNADAIAISNELNRVLFEVVHLQDTINDLNAVVENISDFIETYISVKTNPEALSEEEDLEEDNQVIDSQEQTESNSEPIEHELGRAKTL